MATSARPIMIAPFIGRSVVFSRPNAAPVFLTCVKSTMPGMIVTDSYSGIACRINAFVAASKSTMIAAVISSEGRSNVRQPSGWITAAERSGAGFTGAGCTSGSPCGTVSGASAIRLHGLSKRARAPHADVAIELLDEPPAARTLFSRGERDLARGRLLALTRNDLQVDFRHTEKRRQRIRLHPAQERGCFTGPHRDRGALRRANHLFSALQFET